MKDNKSASLFQKEQVIEAIQAGKEIDKILVKKDIQSDLSKELFAALKGTLIPVQRRLHLSVDTLVLPFVGGLWCH